MTRIFVTGATGVIGRRVVPSLVAAGHDVTAVGRSAEKLDAVRRMGAAGVLLDVFDADATTRAVAGHDVVINLATHMPSSSTRMFLPGSWRENDRVRRVASGILVDAAIAGGATRFIQESFAPIYADRGDEWIDESAPVATARYNRTVLDAERSAERFTESGRIGVVVRFAAFYGPDAFHLADMIKVVRRGWSPLPGSPRAYFSSIHHDDAASAVVATLGARAGIYNVTDDEPLRRREYADSLASALGVGPPKFAPTWLVRLAGSMGELLSRSLRMSNRKLRSECRWAPTYYSVREGWRAVVPALEAGRGAPSLVTTG
jgi:nucleoside-diphosphate-sugar epimerase